MMHFFSFVTNSKIEALGGASRSLDSSCAITLALLLLLLERLLGSIPAKESERACLRLLNGHNQLFFGVDGLLAACELKDKRKLVKFD